MAWINSRSLASERELDEFELRNRIRLSAEHRGFLCEQTNGGQAEEDVAIPTVWCKGGAGDLLGLYGVNHPEDHFDLADALTTYRHLAPRFVPFGYDQGSGQIFVDMAIQPEPLVYIPIDELGDLPVHPYHVANSISEFLVEGIALAASLDE